MILKLIGFIAGFVTILVAVVNVTSKISSLEASIKSRLDGLREDVNENSKKIEELDYNGELNNVYDCLNRLEGRMETFENIIGEKIEVKTGEDNEP